MDDFAAPVRGILKAFDTGIKLAKRISKAASSAHAAYSLRISDSAHALQSTLESSSQAISDAYKQNVRDCGELFIMALDDKSIQSKFKEFRIDLIDQVNDCEFDEDDPATFNAKAFTNVEKFAQKCCAECLAVFKNLQSQSLVMKLQNFKLDEGPKDDRAQLSSMRKPVPSRSPPTSMSTPQNKPPFTVEAPVAEPVKPRGPWSIDSASQFNIGAPSAPGFFPRSTSVPQAPYRGESLLVAADGTDRRRSSNEQSYPLPNTRVNTEHNPGRSPQPVSPLTSTSEQAPPFIQKEIVYSRLSQNEDFLERRRQSRLMFQNEMRNSISSIEENRTSQSFSDGSVFSSPRLGNSTMLSSPASPLTLKRSGERAISPNQRLGSKPSPYHERPALLSERSSSYNDRNRVSETFSDGISPIMEHTATSIDGQASRSSVNGYDTLMTRQRSQGQASQTTRSSRTSSILQDRIQDRPKLDRKGSYASQASQDSIFGLRNAMPLSPPMSEHRASGTENWGTLEPVLQVPSFGGGMESGLEVVDAIDRDNGLMLANEDQVVAKPTPTTPFKLMNNPMRHDTSFYKFGGFCDGAKAMIRGDTGFRVMKRPSGHYSATVSARCVKCSYEVGWNDVEKDRLLDRSGIYGNSGIRFRQKFISKCHLRTNNVDEPMYACVFCIEDNRTVEEHDATVFFSVTKLFQHLAKHSRPVANLAGFSILYDFQAPHVIDFDIHFTTAEPKFQEYSMMRIAPKVTTRPAAYATITHHPKNTRSSSRDPEGNSTLHFAAGARIVGITFPDRFNGTWCIGYHDGERGSFPASAISLEMPVHEDVLMNAQSNLVAFAKWDFKPKDAKEGGWLKFSKGERISTVGYSFQDQWCWSGQTGTGNKSKWGLFPAAFVDGLMEDRGDAGKGKLGSGLSSTRTGSLGGGLGLGSLGSRIGSGLGRHKSSRERERSASIMSNGSVGSTGSGGHGGMVAIQPGLEVVQSPIHTSSGTWRT